MEGVLRLRKLVEGQEDSAILKIVDYLVTFEEMDSNYLNEKKTISSMVDYIKSKVRELTKANFCCVEDQTVYDWAVDYWAKSDDELGIKIIAPVVQKDAKSNTKEVNNSHQLSLFWKWVTLKKK